MNRALLCWACACACMYVFVCVCRAGDSRGPVEARRLPHHHSLPQHRARHRNSQGDKRRRPGKRRVRGLLELYLLFTTAGEALYYCFTAALLVVSSYRWVKAFGNPRYGAARRAGTEFTCFTGPKVQKLTLPDAMTLTRS